jgi:hypothetical protein
MAIQTKIVGDSQAVINVGTPTKNANAIIINTGVGSPIQAFKITGTGGNLAAELGRSGAGVAGAVETILSVVAANATVIAYQVDSNSQLSVITERSSDTNSTLQTAIRLLSSNIGAFSTVDATAATVSTAGGIKLA